MTKLFSKFTPEARGSKSLRALRMRATKLLAGICLLGTAALLPSAAPGSADNGAEPGGSALVLWYQEPAAEWVEALPVGNGRLGAMIFGGAQRELIQFNEDTLWTGKPHEYHHPGASEYLSTVRKLLFEGKQKQAQDLALEHMMSVPLRQKAYQPFGNLQLEFAGHEKHAHYRRALDLDSALASVNYRVGGSGFTREVFSSAPDNVLVVRITSDRKGAVSFSARLDSPHAGTVLRAIPGNQLALAGQVEPEGLKFEARVAVRAEGGGVTATADGLLIQGADSVTLLLAAATSFRNYRDITADPAARCDETLRAAAGKTYDALRASHQEDHRRLFRRVSLDLGSTPATRQPTNRRIELWGKQEDPQLAALYFQYGRYLLIASSRPGCQPANLQGIWNDKMQPPWDSKWTTNINTEMNYWLAEVTGLPECHEPLFDLIDDVAATGRQTAQAHYGCRGWVLHHNTDLWRGTAPINASNHGIWVTGGAWLCRHLWEHYQFTGDGAFLARRAYPVMKEAATFFLDFLTKDPKTGRLISTPSNSPEIGGLVAGPTMDHQIIRDLFHNCIQAAKVLGVDREFAAKLADTHSQIAPNRIGRHGQLQEWLEDKDDPNEHHRHVSHLWGLYPGGEITPEATPEIFEAARQSLIFRGDEGTGWSMAWKISFWARFRDGDHAYRMLAKLLTPVGAGQGPRRGGSYPNLFDAHPPFQIDGNFGATAGIAEMLLQSHGEQIHLLPALPKAWASGKVRGLCARGGYEIGLDWEKGSLSLVLLRSKLGGKCRIRFADEVVDLDTKAGGSYRLNGQLRSF